MQNFLIKIKPIALLVGLSAVAVGIVWIVNQFKSTNTFYSNVSSGLAQAVSFVDETAGALTENDEISAEKITSDNQPKVLSAVKGSSNQCAQVSVQYDNIEVCARNDGDVDYKSGQYSGSYVRKDAEIMLISAQMPLVSLSGSKAVEDSNRKITTQTGVYKPAGEQFTEKEADIESYPNEDSVSYVENKPFSTKYSVAFEQNESEKSEGQLVVDKKIKNNCEYCNNKSNTNPDKTNKIAEFLYNVRMKIPGGNSTSTTKQETIESCSDSQNFKDISGNYPACNLAPAGVIKAWVQTSSISGTLLNECNSEDADKNDKCVRKESIVIKISSMFGSDYKCENGVCTNAYMTARNKVALSPTASSAYSDNTYYLVPCVAMIDGKREDVKCAWDMSYLFKERKVSEYDDIGKEKTPSKSSYENYLLEDAESRQDEPALDML